VSFPKHALLLDIPFHSCVNLAQMYGYSFDGIYMYVSDCLDNVHKCGYRSFFLFLVVAFVANKCISIPHSAYLHPSSACRVTTSADNVRLTKYTLIRQQQMTLAEIGGLDRPVD